MGTTTGPTMSTAAWMNERIVKENKQFPPAEQSPNRVCGKTQKDAFAVPAHGPGPDAHNADVVAKDPVLSDPVNAITAEQRQGAAASWDKESEELRKNKTFGREKCDEVAFSERMQGFSDLARA